MHSVQAIQEVEFQIKYLQGPKTKCR